MASMSSCPSISWVTWRAPAQDGIGGEDLAEVVGPERERLAVRPVMPDAASAPLSGLRIPKARRSRRG